MDTIISGTFYNTEIICRDIMTFSCMIRTISTKLDNEWTIYELYGTPCRVSLQDNSQRLANNCLFVNKKTEAIL